jgi:hypothetical protein
MATSVCSLQTRKKRKFVFLGHQTLTVIDVCFISKRAHLSKPESPLTSLQQTGCVVFKLAKNVATAVIYSTANLLSLPNISHTS